MTLSPHQSSGEDSLGDCIPLGSGVSPRTALLWQGAAGSKRWQFRINLFGGC